MQSLMLLIGFGREYTFASASTGVPSEFPGRLPIRRLSRLLTFGFLIVRNRHTETALSIEKTAATSALSITAKQGISIGFKTPLIITIRSRPPPNRELNRQECPFPTPATARIPISDRRVRKLLCAR